MYDSLAVLTPWYLVTPGGQQAMTACKAQTYACGFAENASSLCDQGQTFKFGGVNINATISNDLSTKIISEGVAATGSDAAPSSIAATCPPASGKDSVSESCPANHDVAIGAGLGVPLGLALLALTLALWWGFSRSKRFGPEIPSPSTGGYSSD